MTDPLLDSALGIFRVLESGDADLAHRVAAPTLTNREAANGPATCSTPGPAGLLASSAWMRSAFPDLHFEVLDADRSGPHVWVRLRMQGTQRGTFVQFADGRPDKVLPPTGKRMDAEQVHLLTVDDTGVTGHEGVRDDLTMLGQLGVLPPTPGLVLAMLAAKLTGRARRAVAEVTAAAEAAAGLGQPVAAISERRR
jgi:predicted ester cyclase